MSRASALVVECSEDDNRDGSVQTTIGCGEEEDRRDKQESKDLGSLHGDALCRNGTTGFIKSVFIWTVPVALIRNGKG
jgi:hypothetical protein